MRSVEGARWEMAGRIAAFRGDGMAVADGALMDRPSRKDARSLLCGDRRGVGYTEVPDDQPPDHNE